MMLSEPVVHVGAPGSAPAQSAPASPPEVAAKISHLVGELFIDLQLLAYADSDGRPAKCRDLQARIGLLLNCPAPRSAHYLMQHASAVAAFLQTLAVDAEAVTDAHLRTVASAADVLDALSKAYLNGSEPEGTDFSVVVLDCDENHRAEVTSALVSAGFSVVSFGTPAETLGYLDESQTALVVINIPVPVPPGYDISKKIKGLSAHENTPILTGLVIRRASAGTKRLFITELAVKALNLIHKTRLPAASAPSPALAEFNEPIPIEAEPASPVEPQAATPARDPWQEVPFEDADTTLFLHQSGAIVAAQPSSAQMFGWSQEELVGMTLGDLLAPEWKAVSAHFLEAYAAVPEDADARFHMLGRRKDGAHFPVLIGLRRMGNNAACQWSVGFHHTDAAPPPLPTHLLAPAEPALALSMRESQEPIQNSLPVESAAPLQDHDAPSAAAPEVSIPSESSEPPDDQIQIQELAALAAQARNDDLAKQLSEVTDRLNSAEARIAEYECRIRDLDKAMSNATAGAEGLKRQLAQAQETTANAQQHTDELEAKLRQAHSELESAKADLDTAAKEQERLQCEWMGRLNALKTAFARAETASRQKEERASGLEARISDLTAQLSEFQAKMEAADGSAARSAGRVSELEQALTTAQEAVAEREHQLEQVTSQCDELAKANEAADAEKEQFSQNLARLREAQRPVELRLADLERQLRERVSSAARSTRELEHERGERRRAEQRAQAALTQLQELHSELGRQLEAEQSSQTRLQDLESRLRESEQALAAAVDEARTHQAEREVAEQQVRALGDLRQHLEQHLARYDASAAAARRTREELSQRLQTAEASLADARSSLQAETRERERLAAAAASAEQQCRTLSAAHQAERAQTEEALESLEREQERLHAELLQTRQQVIEATRESGLRVNGFRRDYRPLLERLRQSVNFLLEAECPVPQREAADGILETAMRLQALLEKSATPVSQNSTSERPNG